MSTAEPSAPLVRIVAHRTGRGLLKDAELLAGLVSQAGFEVEQYLRPSERQWVGFDRWYRLRRRLPPFGKRFLESATQFRTEVLRPDPGLRRVDLNVHLEIPHPGVFRSAHRNWLVPNQEWFYPELEHYMRRLDSIVCKTRHAMEMLNTLHPRVQYAGFTSVFPTYRDIEGRDLSKALHVSGSNLSKGAHSLVSAWLRHPEWPRLIAIIDEPEKLLSGLDFRGRSNLAIRSRVSDQELDELRLSAGWMIAPSQAEGFGHVIFESLATGSCVVSTDAPPMNELVQADRGFLLSWEKSEPMRYGRRFFFNVDLMEQELAKIFSTPLGEIQRRARAGREWAVAHDQSFKFHFTALLKSTLKQ